MRRKLLLGLLTLLVMTTIVGGAFAQSTLPGTGWWTAFQVANVSTSTTGNVTMSAYSTTDATVADTNSQSFAFDTNRQAFLFHPGLASNYSTGGTNIGFSSPLATGFVGSAVVSSDVDVRAVLQIGNNPIGTAGISGGRANAFSQGLDASKTGATMFFPLMKNAVGSQTTLYSVQAIGADANVTITYRYGTSTKTDTHLIKANRQYTFSPAAAAVPNGSVGSATVTTNTSGATLASTVVEYNSASVPASIALSTRGFVASDAGAKLSAPIWKKGFVGGNSGFSVQNIGTSSATVDAEFTIVGVQGATGWVVGDKFVVNNVAIPSNESTIFGFYNIQSFNPTKNGNPVTIPDGLLAAVTVTAQGSGGQLVGVVNESNNTGKAAYQAFANGGTNLSLPIVKEMFPAASPNTTAISVQNVGGVATNITITYQGTGGNRVYTYNNLQPGRSVTSFKCGSTPAGSTDCVLFTGQAPTSGTLYSVTITSSAAPVIAIAQETDQRAISSTSKIDVKNYEGFIIQ